MRAKIQFSSLLKPDLIKVLLGCFLLYAVGCLLPSAKGQGLSDESLSKISFEQRLNQQVSLDLKFRDEEGRQVQLGNYFGKKPVIIVMGYYGCPMLCTLVLNGLVSTLQDIKPTVGEQFEIVNVSINPHETPMLAAAKKKSYLKQYGRRDAGKGWHFLTGEEQAIQQLAKEVGFQYQYDAQSKQYAHPSGFIVLTPEGKVSRYFFGATYSNKELSAVLKEASSNKVGSPIQQLFMLCFHYSPITGKYGSMIMIIVRVCAVLTLLGLVKAIVGTFRKDAARQMPGPVTPAKHFEV
ncbi:MAG: Electron transport protein SCO1/SenC [Pedosphaera sp.]|nr:Electron transport protein SCO1/SenC [Pedosphaera sp.]